MCFTLFIVLSKMHNKFFNISIVRVDEASYGLPWVRKFVFTDKLFTLIKETFTKKKKRNIYLDAFEPPYKFLWTQDLSSWYQCL